MEQLHPGLSTPPRQWQRIALGGAVVLLPLLILGILRLFPALDGHFHDQSFHFQIVSFTALVAFVLGLLVTHLTASVADPRTFFVTLALSALAGIFLVHGLATPGFLLPGPNAAVSWSAILSMSLGSVLFLIATAEWTPERAHWLYQNRSRIRTMGLLLYATYVTIALFFPTPLTLLAEWEPVSGNLAGGLTALIYLLAAQRFLALYLREQQAYFGTLSIALVLLAEAMLPMLLAPNWHLSWWSYHILMLAAVVLVLVAVVRQYEHVRHFHLTPYFSAISAIAIGFFALVSGEVAKSLFDPFIAEEYTRFVRVATSGLFLGSSFLLFVILFQFVQRADRLLEAHARALREQQAALERGRMAEGLVQIGMAIGASLELDEVLSTICESSLRLFGVDAAYLWIKEGNEIVGRAAKGHRAEHFIGLRRNFQEPGLLAARIVGRARPLVINHARTSEMHNALLEEYEVAAALGVPIHSGGEGRGALMLVDMKDPARFTPHDAEVARVFGQQVALALTHAQLYEKIQQQSDTLAHTLGELRESYQVTLAALSRALDARDRETEGHSERVTAYALHLATALGITDPRARDALEWGALLHDVGKIGVPDHILHKPGRLTDEEWTLMRLHPQTGYVILRDVPFLAEALPIVLHHHERWDGGGYPSGLAGNEIPLEARIFAVADTLDAITADRPYRTARSFTEAREEILRHSGTQFDPMVVDAFASIPVEIWERTAEASARSRPVMMRTIVTSSSPANL